MEKIDLGVSFIYMRANLRIPQSQNNNGWEEDVIGSFIFASYDIVTMHHRKIPDTFPIYFTLFHIWTRAMHAYVVDDAFI